jgi:hypothetical protein
VLGENFNPQNTTCIPAVGIFARLELNETISFPDGHELYQSILPKKIILVLDAERVILSPEIRSTILEIVIKCAWCQKIMGTKQFEDYDDKELLITHSICPSCAEKAKARHLIIDPAAEDPLKNQK